MINQSFNRRKFLKLGAATSILPFVPSFISTSCSQQEQLLNSDQYLKSFKEPPSDSRPFVRWWWNGNRLSKNEILRELEVMKSAGIGGVEINPIAFPNDADPVGYESLTIFEPEWLEMLEVALKGAKEKGITCDMIVGSGWPFGGEFLKKEEQSQMVTIETFDLQGNQNYTFTEDELLSRVNPEIHSPNDQVYKEIIQVKLMPAESSELVTGEDITSQLTEGKLQLEVPQGSYVLYYVVKLTGYMAVINGAPGAAGPVLNHYHQQAVEDYLNRVSEIISGKIGPMGDHIRAMFCDSMELEGANWNDDLPDEFKKRRGYDLMPYLPLVLKKVGHMGNPLEEEYGTSFSPEVEAQLKRIDLDYYKTRLELFKERFLQTFDQWCQQNGVKSRMQAYGRGMHPVEASMEIDIPECETWLRGGIGEEYPDRGLRGRAYTMSNKYVASGAVLAGKNIVSCEEITNTSNVFMATLEEIKIAGDQSNLSGVNHSILHGFNYSPPEAPYPGWIRYGTWFNEKNPWWPYFRQWSDYKARLSYLLQNAIPRANVGILPALKDLWWKYGPQRDPFPSHQYPDYHHNLWEAVHQNGGGCDYLSEMIIQQSEMNQGRLSYADRSYELLLLPAIETIEPATMRKLAEFAEGGGKMIFIGPIPHRSPAYQDSEAQDAEVKQIMDKLLAEYPQQVIRVDEPDDGLINWYGQLMKQVGFKSYIEFQNTHRFLNQTPYLLGGQEMFFISNASRNDELTVSARCDLETPKHPWLWNPETGDKKLYPYQQESNLLELYLPPASSMILIFEPESQGEKFEILKPQKNSMNIEGSWQITLQHVNGESTKVNWNELQDLSNVSELKSFAGEIHYNLETDIADPETISQINLGKVHGISELEVNGKHLGSRWYGHHIYQPESAIQKGKNQIRIKVVTIAGNYLKSLEDNQTAQRWTGRQPVRPMGLLGPVSLAYSSSNE